MDYEINERIKALREATGLTQETFGAKIGLSRSEVKNIEYKKTSPKETKIPLIVEKFNVNEQWLRTGEGDMFMQMDRDEEIAQFVASALKGEDDNFRKRLLSMLTKLDEDEWELLEKMAKKMAGE